MSKEPTKPPLGARKPPPPPAPPARSGSCHGPSPEASTSAWNLVGVRCPVSGLVINIKTKMLIPETKTRLWKSMSAAGIELDVVTTCVEDWNELFHIADKLEITGRITPPEWIHWLCEQSLQLNPHIRSSVDLYRYKDEVLMGTRRGGSMSIQQAVEFNHEHNPNEMRRTDLRIALGVLAGAVERYRLADQRRADRDQQGH